MAPIAPVQVLKHEHHRALSEPGHLAEETELAQSCAPGSPRAGPAASGSPDRHVAEQPGHLREPRGCVAAQDRSARARRLPTGRACSSASRTGRNASCGPWCSTQCPGGDAARPARAAIRSAKRPFSRAVLPTPASPVTKTQLTFPRVGPARGAPTDRRDSSRGRRAGTPSPAVRDGVVRTGSELDTRLPGPPYRRPTAGRARRVRGDRGDRWRPDGSLGGAASR